MVGKRKTGKMLKILTYGKNSMPFVRVEILNGTGLKYAGHAGNEMADQLANLGADKTAQELKQPQSATVSQDIKSLNKTGY